MRILIAMLLVSVMGLTACGSRPPQDAEVTRLIVVKEDRKLYLMHHTQILREFDIHLGFAPEGDKQVQGDGRTPEGTYIINRRNPYSAFHLSLGISYPAPHDVEEARRLGKSPGGDIFIHGEPNDWLVTRDDWTEGCIAVTNEEIEYIYARVRDGTPITILP